MPREVVQLQPGVPELISLKFAEGRNYGERVMFSTTDDRILYLDNSEAQELARLGIAKETPFQIVKLGAGKGARHKFVTLNGGGRTYDAPVPVQQPVVNQQHNGNANGHAAPPAAPPEHRVTPQSTKLMACFLSAIDAVSEAQAYATRKGLGITFSSENVTSAALSCYINECRNGGAR